jgi:hypothetical protein
MNLSSRKDPDRLSRIRFQILNPQHHLLATWIPGCFIILLIPYVPILWLFRLSDVGQGQAAFPVAVTYR